MINVLVRNRRPAAEAGPAVPYRRVSGPVVWAVLVGAAFGAGAALRDAGLMPWDPLAPLHAEPRRPSLALWPAVVLAALAVVALPGLARRLRWRPLLAVTWLGALAWTVALAAADGGRSALGRPLTAPTEYLAGLTAMGDDPMGWLRTFTRALPAYPTHVKGHPPLPMLILWTMRWMGLGGAGWAAALVIGAGTSAAVAVAVAVRALADEESARRTIPFLVLTPAAVWVATSMDALFLGVSAWGVALVVLATVGPRSRVQGLAGDGALARLDSRPLGTVGPLPPGGTTPIPSSTPAETSDKAFHSLWITVAAGAVGGVLLGALPYLSYGLVPIFALPLAVLLLTRPPRRVLVALAAGCAVVPVAVTLAGFSWWDGVVATHAAWSAAPGSHDRPYLYFVVGDLATLALITGPATARALSGLPRLGLPRSHLNPPGFRGLPATSVPVMLAGAALIGILALDLSGVTRGEVERIWLPYAVWVTAATALLGPEPGGLFRAAGTAGAHRWSVSRWWLMAQALVALLLQAVVRSPW